MINIVALVGRMTRDPEIRYTATGTPVANFTLAVNRQFANSKGEREADFINCLVWRKAAETICKYTHKGSLIGITGRIQTRNYTNQKNEKVYVTEVAVEGFSFLDSVGKTNNPEKQSQHKPNNTNSNDPFANGGQSIDITDDDLPF